MATEAEPGNNPVTMKLKEHLYAVVLLECTSDDAATAMLYRDVEDFTAQNLSGLRPDMKVHAVFDSSAGMVEKRIVPMLEEICPKMRRGRS